MEITLGAQELNTTLQKLHRLKGFVQTLISAGTCGLGKEKEEINDCTINQEVPDKFSGQIKVCVITLPTQTSGDREWLVQCFTPHSRQLPKASFTGEELFDKGLGLTLF